MLLLLLLFQLAVESIVQPYLLLLRASQGRPASRAVAAAGMLVLVATSVAGGCFVVEHIVMICSGAVLQLSKQLFLLRLLLLLHLPGIICAVLIRIVLLVVIVVGFVQHGAVLVGRQRAQTSTLAVTTSFDFGTQLFATCTSVSCNGNRCGGGRYCSSAGSS
jgi:hypothetical protein